MKLFLTLIVAIVSVAAVSHAKSSARRPQQTIGNVGSSDPKKGNKCSYVLDQEDYGEYADGFLKIGNVKYRCETIRIGGDPLTACRKTGSNSKHFDYAVAFDGAEANYSVYGELSHENAICAGVATTAN